MGVRNRFRGGAGFASLGGAVADRASIFDDAMRDAPVSHSSMSPAVDVSALAARAEPLPPPRRLSAAAVRTKAAAVAAKHQGQGEDLGSGQYVHPNEHAYGQGYGQQQQREHQREQRRFDNGDRRTNAVDPDLPPRRGAAPQRRHHARERGARGGGGGGGGGERNRTVPQSVNAVPGEETRTMRPGVAILLGLMKGVGGMRGSQLAGLRGDSVLVDGKTAWTYRMDQGSESRAMKTIRAEMNPRLYRQGGRLVGPSWARMLLGEEYTEVASKRQVHTLKYTVNACSCLKCLVENACDEQSVPSISSIPDPSDSPGLDFMPGGNDFEPVARVDIPVSPVDVATAPGNLNNGSRQRHPKAQRSVLQTLSDQEYGMSRGTGTAGSGVLNNLGNLQGVHGQTPLAGNGASARPPAHLPPLPLPQPGGRDVLRERQVQIRIESERPLTPASPTRVLQTKPLYTESFMGDLPSFNDVSLLGGAVQTAAQFEIGVVSKLSSRGGSRLTLSEPMQRFVGHAAYTGPVSMSEMYTAVLTFAKAYYKKNKGKRERKVFIRGELQTLPIPCSVLPVGNAPLNVHEPTAVAIIARAQIVNLFHGSLVLEGSFGSFIDMNVPWFLGFGDDKGAQALLANGALSPARSLGINELCVHSDDFQREPKQYILT